MKKSFFVILVLFLLAGCANNQLSGSVVFEEKGIDEYSLLSDFLGKPSIIIFGSVDCDHCRAAMPVFFEQVYTPYKDIINVWVNVDKGRFDVFIPQGYNENLNFNDISIFGVCESVPSWILLNDEGVVVLSSCGSEHSLADLKLALDTLV